MQEIETPNYYSMHDIIGQQLSAVVFVMDYLRLMFNSDYMNVMGYPPVTVRGDAYHPGSSRYRDVLCEIITHIVVRAEARKGDAVEIVFDDDSSIYIPVRDEDYLYGPELVVYEAGSHWWVL